MKSVFNKNICFYSIVYFCGNNADTVSRLLHFVSICQEITEVTRAKARKSIFSLALWSARDCSGNPAAFALANARNWSGKPGFAACEAAKCAKETGFKPHCENDFRGEKECVI